MTPIAPPHLAARSIWRLVRLSLALFLLLSGWGSPARAAFLPEPAAPPARLQLQAVSSASAIAPAFTPAAASAIAPAIAPSPLAPHPLVQEMLAQVDPAQVYSYTAALSGETPAIISGEPYTFTTRSSLVPEAMQQATQYVYEHFSRLGLPASFHEYNHFSLGRRRNVIAEQAGTSEPERIFLITAHLDNLSQNPLVVAPGADDNASGSTGVLVAADILSQYTFGCTLRYALFTGEEQGLYGSSAYAAQAYDNGEQIEAVLNLDMIGYNSDSQPIVDLHTRTGNAGDLEIANTFAAVVDTYALALDPHIFQDDFSYSDHYSFWNYGFPAILAIEDNDDFTPYYHTTGDRLSTLDNAYHTRFIQAAVGTLAHLGCLQAGGLQGTVTTTAGGSPIEGAVVQANRSAGQSWSAVTGASGAYDLTLPPGGYTLTVSAPGYDILTASGITVTHATTTTYDAQLTACASVEGIDFSISSPVLLPHQTAHFTATVAGGTPPYTFEWDFGDGSVPRVTEEFQVQHTYTHAAHPQEIPVRLAVSNACSAPQSISRPLLLQPAQVFLPLTRKEPAP